MRKLTDDDLTAIIGTDICGYRVEAARVKRGEFTDTDHYGIILAVSAEGYHVTWEFHILDDNTPKAYWGRYHMEDMKTALKDYETRDLYLNKQFTVTIIETLKMTVEVEAYDEWEAKQIVSDNWSKGEYILDSEHFTGVVFEAAPVKESDGQEVSED